MKHQFPGLSAVQWHLLPSVSDPRGILTSIESGIDIPFDIKRIFMMHRVTAPRGGHAHLDTDQMIIAASGHFTVELADGIKTQQFRLNDPTQGLYIPRMIYTQLFDFSPDAVCLVLANSHYDMSRSLRSWESFVQQLQD